MRVQRADVSTLLADLRSLGLRRGDRLIVHSSYRAIRPVEGGPPAVIRALMQAVGEEGTLAMPTFQDVPPEVFDLHDTKSDCGILTELFRKMPGVHRSLHPTHSVAVWGSDAAFIASAHEEGRTALGVDSPFDRLARLGGKVLLLGVGQNRNSMVHVGEARFGVPYLPLPFSPDFARPLKVRGRDGTIFTMRVEECPGCSENFGKVDQRMQATGRIVRGRVGNAPASLMAAEAVVRTVCELLEEDPASLLCRDPACPFCPSARRMLSPASGRGA